MLHPILNRWRMSALIASAAMLATAHAFQTFGGYQPCTLCLRQREVYWVAAGVALAAMIVVRTPPGARLKAVANALLGLVFLVGAGVAIYHAGAEWKFWPGPTACSSGGVGVSADAMAALVGGESIRAARCDEAPWVFAGLSMAGWNALASLSLAVLSLIAALRERRR
ncbi:disulfide bond formation protein B [Phenylobacterium immobile]|uniref:disulfide bond formation protein B n=1 Tax=Phenylobacterium immobile TaxID=21 RepID=UPI000B26D983|nr:disulfide bond formation protein B [Phenylobacterium immobile]